MNKEKISTVAERLRYALAFRQLKQVDIVNMTGINKAYISNYMSGNYEPKHERLTAIAKALNVSEIWLAGYDVPMERKLENKNDDLARITVRLRKDNEYFETCLMMYDMSLEELNSIKGLIVTFTKK